MKILFICLLLTISSVFVYSQSNKKTNMHDKNMNVKGQFHLPKEWEMRFDESNASINDLKLVKENNFYHFTTGPAAIYYNPKNKVGGQYKITAEFIQLKPSKHPEAYGIFLAGSNLQNKEQHYIYFLTRQDGKYLIKIRNGKDTKDIINWTADENINPQDKNGKTQNKLTVTVTDRTVIFGANGKAVMSLKKSNFGGTVGIAGLRINHNLNVKATDITINKF
jgi:hypothetical protein